MKSFVSAASKLTSPGSPPHLRLMKNSASSYASPSFNREFHEQSLHPFGSSSSSTPSTDSQPTDSQPTGAQALELYHGPVSSSFLQLLNSSRSIRSDDRCAWSARVHGVVEGSRRAESSSMIMLERQVVVTTIPLKTYPMERSSISIDIETMFLDVYDLVCYQLSLRFTWHSLTYIELSHKKKIHFHDPRSTLHAVP